MLDFWDGVMISSLLWYVIAAVCLIRGYWVGSQFDTSGWGEGFDSGWNSAVKTYMPEIMEKEHGMNV